MRDRPCEAPREPCPAFDAHPLRAVRVIANQVPLMFFRSGPEGFCSSGTAIFVGARRPQVDRQSGNGLAAGHERRGRRLARR